MHWKKFERIGTGQPMNTYSAVVAASTSARARVNRNAQGTHNAPDASEPDSNQRDQMDVCKTPPRRIYTPLQQLLTPGSEAVIAKCAAWSNLVDSSIAFKTPPKRTAATQPTNNEPAPNDLPPSRDQEIVDPPGSSIKADQTKHESHPVLQQHAPLLRNLRRLFQLAADVMMPPVKRPREGARLLFGQPQRPLVRDTLNLMLEMAEQPTLAQHSLGVANRMESATQDDMQTLLQHCGILETNPALQSVNLRSIEWMEHGHRSNRNLLMAVLKPNRFDAVATPNHSSAAPEPFYLFSVSGTQPPAEFLIQATDLNGHVHIHEAESIPRDFVVVSVPLLKAEGIHPNANHRRMIPRVADPLPPGETSSNPRLFDTEHMVFSLLAHLKQTGFARTESLRPLAKALQHADLTWSMTLFSSNPMCASCATGAAFGISNGSLPRFTRFDVVSNAPARARPTRLPVGENRYAARNRATVPATAGNLRLGTGRD